MSGTIYCNDIRYTQILQNFDRLEYSNNRLRSAPSIQGAQPLIVQGFGNKPIQLLTTCTQDLPRPLTPDDSNIANIKRRFNILRYTIQGAANLTTDITNLFTIWQSHVILLNRFDLYLAELQMDLSINHLQNVLQPLTFSYLTSTGLSITGNAIGGTQNNMLITEFEVGIAYEAPVAGSPSTSTVLQDFNMVIENRTIASQGPI